MQIVFGLLFLLFFSACCLCVAACTRFDAALLPLPALCGSAVVLYLLSLLGLLQFGHFIIMAVWLAGGVYFGVRAGWRAIRRALFSPGFLLFVGGSCFLWVLFALQQPMFTQWDEFTAWGLAPKTRSRSCWRGEFLSAGAIAPGFVLVLPLTFWSCTLPCSH